MPFRHTADFGRFKTSVKDKERHFAVNNFKNKISLGRVGAALLILPALFLKNRHFKQTFVFKKRQCCGSP